MPVRFTTTLRKFGDMGEKTGWTYVIVPKSTAEMIKPNTRRSFRVKGLIDKHPISFVALIPFGEGDFIIAINAEMRKGIRKGVGSKVVLELVEDKSEFVLSPVFMECLADDPDALSHFNSLLPSHQRYFSKWIDSAKTEPTKTKRISRAINALAKGWGYAEMLRAGKE